MHIIFLLSCLLYMSKKYEMKLTASQTTISKITLLTPTVINECLHHKISNVVQTTTTPKNTP